MVMRVERSKAHEGQKINGEYIRDWTKGAEEYVNMHSRAQVLKDQLVFLLYRVYISQYIHARIFSTTQPFPDPSFFCTTFLMPRPQP
jgi:hypothetical protein